MEAISAVAQSSDLIVEVLLLLDPDDRVPKHSSLVLGMRQAHVVIQVCHEFSLVDIVLIKEFRLLLLNALEHGLIVGGRINHAHVVKLSRLDEVLILFEGLCYRGSL